MADCRSLGVSDSIACRISPGRLLTRRLSNWHPGLSREGSFLILGVGRVCFLSSVQMPGLLMCMPLTRHRLLSTLGLLLTRTICPIVSLSLKVRVIVT